MAVPRGFLLKPAKPGRHKDENEEPAVPTDAIRKSHCDRAYVSSRRACAIYGLRR